MTSYRYEIHKLQSPLLPFIFHPLQQIDHEISQPHWHENLEILHCLGGSGYVICGSKRSSFCTGDLLVINTNTSHIIASEASVEYSCLIVGNLFGTQNGLTLPSLTFQERIQDPLLSQQFQAVSEAFGKFSEDSPLSCADIRYQVLGLLRLLCAKYLIPDKGRSSPNANVHVARVLTYIREHLDKKITLEALASHVGISKYHLSHIFREYTGKTVFSAINQIRCNEAKQLIESGMSVSEAALCCGFENLSHFSNTFKQIFHIRPSSCAKEDPK